MALAPIFDVGPIASKLKYPSNLWPSVPGPQDTADMPLLLLLDKSNFAQNASVLFALPNIPL
jgi:hypothetical protein